MPPLVSNMLKQWSFLWVLASLLHVSGAITGLYHMRRCECAKIRRGKSGHKAAKWLIDPLRSWEALSFSPWLQAIKEKGSQSNHTTTYIEQKQAAVRHTRFTLTHKRDKKAFVNSTFFVSPLYLILSVSSKIHIWSTSTNKQSTSTSTSTVQHDTSSS